MLHLRTSPVFKMMTPRFKIINKTWWHYINIDWCQGHHWKIMPRSCVMLPEGQRPEGNIAQLRGIIFRCWSRLTVNICFVISRKAAFYTVPYRPIQTRNSHTFNLTRNICSNFCQRLYYFHILKFFKVPYTKGKRKQLINLFNDETTVTSQLTKSALHSAEYIIDLPDIAFGPKISRECNVDR